MAPVVHPTRTLLARLSSRATLPVAATVAVQLAYLLTTWNDRQRSRHRLRHLPDHILKDIGITEQQAEREAEKHFWHL